MALRVDHQNLATFEVQLAGEMGIGPSVCRSRAQLNLDTESPPQVVLLPSERWMWAPNKGHVAEITKALVQLLASIGRDSPQDLVLIQQDM
jgi:hypothetical protein